MKKHRLLNLMAAQLLALIMAGCSGPTDPHIGEWTNTHPSPESFHSIVFNKDNSAIFSMGDMKMGGNNFAFMEEGIEMRMQITYEVDYEKDPVWIDITMFPVELKFSEGSEEYSPEQKQMLEEMVIAQGKQNPSLSKGIIRFLSDNQMELQASETSRPTAFDPESDDYSLLNRTK